MKIKKTSIFIKVVATVLAIILFAPVNALAAAPGTVMPMASAYLASYTAYICALVRGPWNWHTGISWRFVNPRVRING